MAVVDGGDEQHREREGDHEPGRARRDPARSRIGHERAIGCRCDRHARKPGHVRKAPGPPAVIERRDERRQPVLQHAREITGLTLRPQLHESPEVIGEPAVRKIREAGPDVARDQHQRREGEMRLVRQIRHHHRDPHRPPAAGAQDFHGLAQRRPVAEQPAGGRRGEHQRVGAGQRRGGIAGDRRAAEDRKEGGVREADGERQAGAVGRDRHGLFLDEPRRRLHHLREAPGEGRGERSRRRRRGAAVGQRAEKGLGHEMHAHAVRDPGLIVGAAGHRLGRHEKDDEPRPQHQQLGADGRHLPPQQELELKKNVHPPHDPPFLLSSSFSAVICPSQAARTSWPADFAGGLSGCQDQNAPRSTRGRQRPGSLQARSAPPPCRYSPERRCFPASACPQSAADPSRAGFCAAGRLPGLPFSVALVAGMPGSAGGGGHPSHPGGRRGPSSSRPFMTRSRRARRAGRRRSGTRRSVCPPARRRSGCHGWSRPPGRPTRCASRPWPRPPRWPRPELRGG